MESDDALQMLGIGILLTKFTATENVMLSMEIAAICDERYELKRLQGEGKRKGSG